MACISTRTPSSSSSSSSSAAAAAAASRSFSPVLPAGVGTTTTGGAGATPAGRTPLLTGRIVGASSTRPAAVLLRFPISEDSKASL
eukprot:CAMPEP_0174977028 /NCGR_PEP_ID=MMETSP0004_2-20121128/13370_1 /TAXON_ID=420556 /ORGANISM="Ochromonas sp., Strain CCMP1393" /LENGTH=85 /DNA_ID=CAMNT_0016228143 /DNA_START=467 /DNA_END=720 /DNA_ORIENTATION=-